MDLDSTVRALAPRLLGYCFLETGDHGLAEEISQDALTALVQRWRHHGPPDSPDAFVFAVARRRSARAAVRRRLWQPIEAVLRFGDGRPSPEQKAVLAHERAEVVRALSQLRRTDRQVLLLVTVWGVGFDEAARALGISRSAAKMRAMRARLRLRDLLGPRHRQPDRSPGARGREPAATSRLVDGPDGQR